MNPKNVITVTADGFQTHSVMKQIQDDPLYTQSFPHAFLFLSPNVKIDSTLLETFGLQCVHQGDLQIIHALNATSSSYGIDFVSLFGFTTTLLDQDELTGAELRLENTLNQKMRNAVDKLSPNKLKTKTENPTSQDIVGQFKINAAGVRCLTDAGFELLDQGEVLHLSKPQMFELKAQLLKNVEGAPKLSLIKAG